MQSFSRRKRWQHYAQETFTTEPLESNAERLLQQLHYLNPVRQGLRIATKKNDISNSQAPVPA